MNRFAPSWLPRQQRRRIDRELDKLIQRDVCSLCGAPNNTRTAPGLDAQGNAAVAGECCFDRLSRFFAIGFYSTRRYDFLHAHNPKPDIKLTAEQIVDAVAAWQKNIADTDQLLAGVERRGGDIRASEVNVQDYAWKRDDARWFEQNPSRSHRARAPFPGEIEDAELPTGCVPIMLIRQIEPSCRMRVACDLSVDLLPLPDDEAAVHALFDTAMRREAVTVQTVRALIEEYRTKGAH